MQVLIRRSISALLLGAFLVLGQGGLSNAASPSAPSPSPALTPPPGTLAVIPPLISMTVAPGATGASELTVSAGVPLDVSIAVDGLEQGLDGAFEPIPAAKDTSPYTARSMIAFTPQSFKMQAGGSQKVKVTLSVPQDAGEGTRYAILKITGLPVAGSKNVGIGVSLGVTSLITLAKTDQTHTGAIRGLAISKPTSGEPLAASGTLTNTGNSHFGAVPNQVVTDASLQAASGEVIAHDKVTVSGNSLVPTFGRQFTVPLQADRPMVDGAYHLEVEARLQDGTLLDRAALDFEITGGAVVGETAVPVLGPPAVGGGGISTESLLLFLAVVLGVAIGAVAFGVLVRRNRRT